MSPNILFERDILYPTKSSNDPGSIHIQVLEPDENSRIPIIIEDKSSHSPLEYIDNIIRIMQSDIFNRVSIDIRNNTVVYIKVTAEMKAEYGGYSHIKLSFSEDGVECIGVDR